MSKSIGKIYLMGTPYNVSDNDDKTTLMRRSFNRMIADEGLMSEAEINDRVRNSHVINFKSLGGLVNNFFSFKNNLLNDKYKHAMLNCMAAQSGIGGMLEGTMMSGVKELSDIYSGSNTLSESYEDDAANNLGRYLGFKYPNGDCDEMVQKYISKK